jgi:putative ABC transport system permease protein
MNVASLKLALKVLSRRKVFTAISLAGIALTLVVLIVAAAILDNVFAASEPQSKIDRMLFLVTVGKYGPTSSLTTDPGAGFLAATVRDLPHVEAVSIHSSTQQATVFQGGRRIETKWKQADGAYWRVHDFRFIEGSPFSEADRQANRPVAVITQRMRDALFGDGPALGHSFELGGRTYRVVGVVPRTPIARISAYSEIWTPLPLPTSAESGDLFGNYRAVVLADRASSIPAIKNAFAARVKRYPIDDPKTFHEIRSGLDTGFETFARQMTENHQPGSGNLLVSGCLIAVAILFMTLPALNLITLNLSRIMERAPEVGVRKAFGAPRSTLIAQFVAENIVLTVIGGAIAFVLASIALHMLEASEIVPDLHFEVNLRVFAWGMVVATFFGIFSGLYPAWRMSRLDPIAALRGGAL